MVRFWNPFWNNPKRGLKEVLEPLPCLTHTQASANVPQQQKHIRTKAHQCEGPAPWRKLTRLPENLKPKTHVSSESACDFQHGRTYVGRFWGYPCLLVFRETTRNSTFLRGSSTQTPSKWTKTVKPAFNRSLLAGGLSAWLVRHCAGGCPKTMTVLRA